MKKYRIDHICLKTKDIEATTRLFEEVFGMEIIRTVGQKPGRKLWMDGGIQLCEVEEFDPKGGMDHYAIDVPAEEMEEIFHKAEQYGCRQAEGYAPFQWLYMPEGQMLELTNITWKLTH